jgi:hypothetical protein
MVLGIQQRKYLTRTHTRDQITAAQRVSLKLASEMNTQVQIRTAKDVLAASEGGANPA